MSPPPIPMVFDGNAFNPLPNFLRIARENYGAGEVVSLVQMEERSAASHRHYFASVNEAWANLPEHLAERFKSADALRKRALIMTGWYHETTTVCMFKTEARRLAAMMQQLDDFAVVVVNGKMVSRLTAKSQTLLAMGKADFQKSKDDVLGYLADLIGVAPAQLETARAA